MNDNSYDNGSMAEQSLGVDGDPGDAAKIFVGGLDWNLTVDELRAYFEQFGAVFTCSIKTDRNTGQSRGFGFVQFEDPAVVDEVVSVRNHVLGGSVIDPKRLKYKETLASTGKIFVGGLDPQITEETIREYFGKFGTIDELDLPYDRTSNERRRFCFVRFTSNDPVTRLCALPKHTIAGKTVEVKRALNKNELAAQFQSPYQNPPSARGRGGPYGAANGHWSHPYANNGLQSPGVRAPYSYNNIYGGQFQPPRGPPFRPPADPRYRQPTASAYGGSRQPNFASASAGYGNTNTRYSIPPYNPTGQNTGKPNASGYGVAGSRAPYMSPAAGYGPRPQAGSALPGGRGRDGPSNFRYQPYGM